MKGDKYLSIALSINFLLTLSCIFENVVKILTGRLLEVPLWSSETMAIFASCGKVPFGKLLFIAFDKG